MSEPSTVLPGAVYTGYKCKVFEIDDGGTHWVAAKSLPDAYRIMAEVTGYSVAEYLEELEPKGKELAPSDKVIVNLDPCTERHEEKYRHETKHSPSRARIEVRVREVSTAEDWMRHDYIGVICTTEV